MARGVSFENEQQGRDFIDSFISFLAPEQSKNRQLEKTKEIDHDKIMKESFKEFGDLKFSKSEGELDHKAMQKMLEEAYSK